MNKTGNKRSYQRGGNNGRKVIDLCEIRERGEGGGVNKKGQ